ncbi:hypothetical protein ONZ45_g15906 [Pleurotus djamor]|nr:hypothetical protein ONZ45_g15906 [Pleurotus djamor]
MRIWHASDGEASKHVPAQPALANVTPQDVQESLQVNVEAAFAFSRQSILEFKSNDIDAQGKRGTLIFTGATASIRGNVTTSAFAAGKAAQRSLSQSLAKEFGKENIHVAHAIIDGVILTGRTKDRISKIGEDSQWDTNANVRLDPNSIASSYLYLVNQDRSSWTWELDLRPAHERCQSLYASPSPMSMPIPDKNNVEMNREMLLRVLDHFSTVIPVYFDNRPVRLVVHGGACMLLHPKLYPLTQSPPMSQSLFVGDDGRPIPIPAKRTATRDVDYIDRSFAAEWKKQGVVDATERLKKCIRITASQFGLGADWMNSDADVALPMASDPRTGTVYDPIYKDSLRPNNVHLHTIFTSRNQQLTLVSVTPFWAVALKLVRYCKWDPGDICALLRNGTLMSNVTWTPEILEGWLHKECWSMGYASYDVAKVMEMRKRIQHAVAMVNAWNSSEPPSTQPQATLPTPPSSANYTSSSFAAGSRFAPEAWSMGGQGMGPAAPPVSSAWTVPPPSPPDLPDFPAQTPSSSRIGMSPTPVMPNQVQGQWSTPSTLSHHTSSPASTPMTQRDSWVGGWALSIQNPSNPRPPPPSVQSTFPDLQQRPPQHQADTGGNARSSLGLSLGAEAPGWNPSDDRIDVPRTETTSHPPSRLGRPRYLTADYTNNTREVVRRASFTREPVSHFQTGQNTPVIPAFLPNEPEASRARSSSSNGSLSLGLPAGFVAMDEASPYEWYGLSEEEKQAVMRDRMRRATTSSPYSQPAEPQPEPVIPRDDLLQKTPLTRLSYMFAETKDNDAVTQPPQTLSHRASQSFTPNGVSHRPDQIPSTMAWHPESAERGARVRERNRLAAASSSLGLGISPRPAIPEDDELWKPYHGRGVAADNNLRHSQSLGVL